MTNDIERRVFEHKKGVNAGFTSRYAVTRLVYYETLNDPESAILREKRLKKWKRLWKIKLIEDENPYWEDLSSDWYSPEDFTET